MNNRKRLVADVALKLFIEKGIQQTSIQEIIDVAKISKGTFYNYFSTKNDCIAEILEMLRYDARQQRMEIQMGKDEKDRSILIDQISIIIQLNEERKLSAFFEAILNSNELDLKKLVMHHRIYELEWLAERFIEVFGEHLRPYAFELVVLYSGMMNFLLFTIRLTNTTYSVHHIVAILFSYIELIIPKMIENRCVLLDHSALHLLRAKIDRKVTSKEEILDMAKHIEEIANFTIDQQDLFDTITAELKRERIRKSVLQPLVRPFQQSFSNTALEVEISNFTNTIWYFLKML